MLFRIKSLVFLGSEASLSGSGYHTFLAMEARVGREIDIGQPYLAHKCLG